jgi:hypothetical protein
MNNMHELNKILEAIKTNRRITKEELQRVSDFEILNMDMKDKTVKVKRRTK